MLDSFFVSRISSIFCPLILSGVKSPKSLLPLAQTGLSLVKVADVPMLLSDKRTAVRYNPILMSEIMSPYSLIPYMFLSS